MNEEITYRGTWFLPADRETCISGILQFNPTYGATLELSGAFSGQFMPDLDDEIMILGYTTTGKEITLFKCKETQRTTGFLGPGPATSQFKCNYVFIGNHFNSAEELRFDKFEISIEDFHEWLKIPRFNSTLDEDKKSLIVSINCPDSIPFKFTNQIIGKINFGFKYDSKSGEFHIYQANNISISFASKVEFKLIIETATKIIQFFTLAYLGDLPMAGLTLYEADLQTEFFDKLYPKKIETLFSSRHVNWKYKSKHFHEFLFSFEHIEANFEATLMRWFDICEKIQIPIALLSETFYSRNILAENKFLNVAQAIESFHRLLRNNEVLPKQDHKTKIFQIINSVDEENRDWLKQRLQYSNEPNLRKRLTDLVEEVTNLNVSNLIGNSEEFVKIVVDNRNYYTHYDKRLKRKALKPVQLHYLTEKLKIFLTYLVLKEIKLTDEQLNSIFAGDGYRLHTFFLKK